MHLRNVRVILKIGVQIWKKSCVVVIILQLVFLYSGGTSKPSPPPPRLHTRKPIGWPSHRHSKPSSQTTITFSTIFTITFTILAMRLVLARPLCPQRYGVACTIHQLIWHNLQHLRKQSCMTDSGTDCPKHVQAECWSPQVRFMQRGKVDTSIYNAKLGDRAEICARVESRPLPRGRRARRVWFSQRLLVRKWSCNHLGFCSMR